MEPSLDLAIQMLIELRDRSSPWDSASDLFPGVYWESDADGRLVKVQGACEELLEVSPARLLGQKIQSLWPDESDDLSQWHDRTLQSGELYLQCWVKPRPQGYRGLILDYTPPHRALAVQHLESEQLRAASRQLGDHITGLRRQIRLQEAHCLTFGRQLRTLMHRMTGLLALLRQQPLRQAQEANAEAISACLEHLMHLALPLEEAGGAWSLETHLSDFDPRQAVNEVGHWLLPEAAARGIELEISIAPSIPEQLRGDVQKLRQVLLHLLDNAMQYSDGGDVALELTGHAEVRFCVRDHGRGMSQEKLESLFQENLFEGDLHSLGLGVKLARYLVEQMGGRIWADSEEKRGTSIYFTLPLAEGAGSSPLRADPGDGPGRLTILLAEDDAISQKVTLRSLTKMGHKVDIVSSGLDVLEALPRFTYDVVLLDVEMPGLDGLETARQIHRRFTPTPYMIALTAGTSAADRRKCMLAGIHDYIAKPLRHQELADALTQVAGSRAEKSP